MKTLTKSLLAGALIAALPMGGALACTTDAWSSVTGAPIADDPDINNATNGPTDAGQVARYSGQCGLSAPAGAFVTSEHPDGASDTVYRARFYVYTSAAGTTKVFSAEDSGSAEVMAVSYLPGSDAFSFTIPGSTVANVTGIDPGKWYGIEVLRDVGAPAQVFVRGGGGGGPPSGEQSAPQIDVSVVGTGNATGNAVDVAHLGSLSGGAVIVDEFESTRSEATAIGFLLRGDANDTGTVDTGDVSATAREAVGSQIFSGQPDCNESGGIDSGDVSCVARVAVGL